NDPTHFLFERNRSGVRARRLAADIEEMSASLNETERMVDDGPFVEEATAVGEAVGRDVDDSHDERRGARREGGVAGVAGQRRQGSSHGISIRCTISRATRLAVSCMSVARDWPSSGM